MSLIQGTSMASAAGGFDVPNAIHLSYAASQYFTRTPASAGNRRTFTISWWQKVTGLVNPNFKGHVIGTTVGTYDRLNFGEDSTAKLAFTFDGAGSSKQCFTTALFRDNASYGHFVAAVDTTQVTDTNRVKIYYNGVQQTLTGTFPTLNYQSSINNNVAQYVGSDRGSTYFLDGNISEFAFVDGQALDPSYFGEFDDNGIWRPIDVSGLTFGTNGFYLNSADGVDQSGNSNNFTPTNSPTDTLDTPTDVAGALTPLIKLSSGWTITNGGLTGTATSVGNSIGTNIVYRGSGNGAGKFFTLHKAVSNPASTYASVGLMSIPRAQPLADWAGYAAVSYGVLFNSSKGSYSADYPTQITLDITITTNDWVMIAYDEATREFWAGVNGVWCNSGDPAAGTGALFTLETGYDWLLVHSDYGATNTNIVTHDFGGSAPHAYEPPTGFAFPTSAARYAANPPAIEDGSAHFQTALHTGTGSALTINQTGNSTFTPDFVWTKGRSGATNHVLSNIISGTGKYLSSNCYAETTDAQALTAFGSGSISYGTLAAANTNAATYVDWMWKCGGAGVSNASGSITSTVSANTTAGFSIVTYTGTGVAATIAHGLGTTPTFIIVKRKSTSESWRVYTSTTGNTAYMNLENTDASSSAANMWNNTSPTSSVFSISTQVSVNSNGGTFVAICFAPIASFSAMSQYTGNGSADGPFIYTGFKPAWILFKNASVGSHWLIYDTARDTYNVMTLDLSPNAASAEPAVMGTAAIDVVSNGFKIRTTNANLNGSGNTIIYAAFAEVPSFGATPAKAR
jgi:hypothetical protein